MVVADGVTHWDGGIVGFLESIGASVEKTPSQIFRVVKLPIFEGLGEEDLGIVVPLILFLSSCPVLLDLFRVGFVGALVGVVARLTAVVTSDMLLVLTPSGGMCIRVLIPIVPDVGERIPSFPGMGTRLLGLQLHKRLNAATTVLG